MEQFLDIMKSAPPVQQGVFVLVGGVFFVFAVQVVFYLTVKIWMHQRPKKAVSEE